jgi:hypothetical protein
MHGGLPVPYVVEFAEGGKPGFSFNSVAKVLEVGRKGLCGQCGEPLEHLVAFVGAPEFCAGRVFGEPGMHEECARYALATCPHLVSNRVRGLKRVPTGVRVLRHGSEGRAAPKQWCLYITRGYTIVKTKTGVPAFKVPPAIRVHWFRAGRELTS